MKFAQSNVQNIQAKKRALGGVIGAALLAGVGSAANAAPMFINLASIDALNPNKYDLARETLLISADADSSTGTFTEFGFSQLLATSIYDFSDGSVFGSFSDTNNAASLAAAGVPASGTALDGTTSVSLVPPNCVGGQCDIDALSPLVPPIASDNEGFLQSWDLQVEYTFDGTLTAAGPVYTGGSFEVTFNSFLDDADDQVVLRGLLTGSNVQAANLDLFFDVDFALDGFLFVERGGSFIDAGLNDLQSGSTNPVTLTLDTNVNPPIPDADQLLLVGTNAIRQTTLDGSVTAQIPVPGTLALLGLGIAGLGAGVARRRRRA